MNTIQTLDELYSAIKNLALLLNAAGYHQLAANINSRMYEACWTTGSELLEELHAVLFNALRSNELALPQTLKDDVEHVRSNIVRFLSAEDS